MVFWLLLGLLLGFLVGTMFGGMAVKLQASKQLIDVLMKQSGGGHADR
jgi:hypothetical protein